MEPFTIFCKGEHIGGNVTFWQDGESYYYQSEGIGEPKKCSKKLYDEAVEEYKKQTGNGRFREGDTDGKSM